jgi:HK97 family phage major capsid protein
MNVEHARRRAAELSDEIAVSMKAVKDGTMTQKAFSAFMDKAENENAELETTIKNYERALQFRRAPHDNGYAAGTPMGKSSAVNLPDAAMKALHEAVLSQTTFSTKSFSTVESLVPPVLAPNVLGKLHEDRLIAVLPTQAIDAPAYSYIRHTSTTGAPAVTAEGAAKPELVLATDKVTATPVKIAAHTAVSYESMQDFDAFTSYVLTEMNRQIIDVENAEILNGSGSGGHLTGLLNTSGILTHAIDTETPLDAIEMAIAELRVGSSLATANLLVLHPSDWSLIRRSKDSQDRYLTTADPTRDEANSVWGVPVLTTTVMSAGTGMLMDTMKFGKVIVREAITVKTGTNTDDFVKNLTRFVAEERIGLAVERPSAVLKITGIA